MTLVLIILIFTFKMSSLFGNQVFESLAFGPTAHIFSVFTLNCKHINSTKFFQKQKEMFEIHV